jgi:phosphocarrier protein
MKQARVKVLWKEGLHLRHAARLVRRARSFRSSISLQVNERITDARSILGVLLLCATLGTLVDLQVSGEDEDAAIAALTSLFESGDPDDASISPRHGDST